MKYTFSKRITVALFLGVLGLIIAFFSCPKAMANPAQRELALTSKIGIISAMDPELDLLLDAVLNPIEEQISGMSFFVGTTGRHPVAIVKCGVGKVSAALGTQVLIDRFSPDFIINTGCAGSLQSSVDIRDIVLATSTVEWDLDTTSFGHPRGYVHALDKSEMVADHQLLRQIERHVPATLRLNKGLIISGDSFIDTQAQRDMLLGFFPSAQCVEMEGAAVGHVCAQNGVPFCVLRSISDDCNGSATIDYNEFVVEASGIAANILLNFLLDENL